MLYILLSGLRDRTPLLELLTSLGSQEKEASCVHIRVIQALLGEIL